MQINRTFDRSTSERNHLWVTVVDPLNQRSLLQACDNCGVVKSENSVVRACKAPQGQALISAAMAVSHDIAV
jgi:DNA-binding transcriptional MocR family regulator